MVFCQRSYILKLFSSGLKGIFVEYIYSTQLIVARENAPAFMYFIFWLSLKIPAVILR